MIPVATEKAGLPDDWSILGAAVFAGIGVAVVRPHLYSIRSPPQGIVAASAGRVGTRSARSGIARRLNVNSEVWTRSRARRRPSSSKILLFHNQNNGTK